MSPSIFVSSTFTDLQHHRKLVLDAIGSLEFASQAMEVFGALPGTPKDECLRLVRSADIYIGIFAMRYGFVDPLSSKSLTQLEYEEAQVVHLPSLIYIIDEDTHTVLPKFVDTGAEAEKLRVFKKILKNNHVVNFYSSPDDLVKKVTQDIVRLVSAAGNKPTARVLAKLSQNAVKRHPLTPPRFQFLKQRTAHIFNDKIPSAILQEAFELVLGGDKMAAAFLLSRGASISLDDAIDGLMEFEKILIEILRNNEHQQRTEK
ncbi:DUF4062 domain-containing protein [Pseudomonas fluorescens]|uniref:DUF4062 domain-containing protein n=1 Tax=Pseudomonas fluorescens TaxID=294 RepID=UPI0005FABFA7|nr:DUF4062 domain-containing protein [Pseudomonas fluorescens]KJZ38230.1 hypothetical protein VC33_11975 [Pseudomonas fluorescens]